MPLLDELRAAFAGRLLTDAAETAPFLRDWRGKWTGRAIAVAQPDTAEDVAAVVRFCRLHRVPVVAQGGNTGLSGGAVPDNSGRALVLSLARLNRIRHIDLINNTVEVEAGVTLQQLRDTVQEAGRLFPLSLAAQGTCTIGGNLATNAGGVQVLRYGNARELCLGLQVATPEGDLWDGLRGLRKDNTGYDLRDLYIGSEGTLGVITAAVLKLHQQPAGQAVAWAAVSTVDAAVQLLQLAQIRAQMSLTAFELISDTSLGLVIKHVSGARAPLPEASPWYVLIEMSDLRDAARAQATMVDLLGEAFEQGLVNDAAMSESHAQFRKLWALRENISEAQAAEGPVIKHDIALPLSAIAEFIATMEAALTIHPQLKSVIFGHLGDGNLHYNMSPMPGHAREVPNLEASVNGLVHRAVAERQGSISAEHGLGVLRRDESARYKSLVELNLMRTLKSAFDPLNLMNPNKLLSSVP